MFAGAEGDFLTRCNLNRDAVVLALFGVLGDQRLTLGQIVSVVSRFDGLMFT